MTPAIATVIALASAPPPAAAPYFAVHVRDAQSGRGVPLVELKTVHHVSYFTDGAGVAAVNEPGLANRDVYFELGGPGYEAAKDGFGFRGVRLRVVPGGSAVVHVTRTQPAERLYRVTGEGVYRDCKLAGLPAPGTAPTDGIVGCDSVLTAAYRGRMFWVWGDTAHPGYPLGNYHASAATSPLPFPDPARGIRLTHFTDKACASKEMCKMPGTGPTWITSLVVLPDAAGRERLYASYVKVKPPLTVYARGLAVFDDAREVFTHLAEVPMSAAGFPNGHAFRHTEAGIEYVYFGNPFPVVRVRASAADYVRPERYETYTCLAPDDKPDRDADGRARYAWRPAARVLGPAEEEKMVAAGTLRPEEARWRPRDVATVKTMRPHSGSVSWNEYRMRWVMVAVEINGSASHLGEVWYSEAAAPTGPWRHAAKVATHPKMSFYNPMQHPEFAADGGRVIYFEGTYTHTFSGNPHPTPRYEYNQLMYRLDLADPRLKLPAD